MDEQRPVGWHLDRATDLFRYWDGTQYTTTATAKELRQHRADAAAVEGAHFTTDAYIDGKPVETRKPVTGAEVARWVVLAAVAVAVVWFVWSLLAGPPTSPHATAIRDALAGTGVGIESITQEGGTSHATITTDLNALDPLDTAAAAGICRTLEATPIPGLLGVSVKSAGGLDLTSCIFVDRE